MKSSDVGAAMRPVIWRALLTSPQSKVWDFLTNDRLRERYWARRSVCNEAGFELHFAGGIVGHVLTTRAEFPKLEIEYFGAPVTISLRDRDGRTEIEIQDRCEDPEDWDDRHAGWVSWLLTFKAAVDFGVDLRNGGDDFTWADHYADQ